MLMKLVLLCGLVSLNIAATSRERPPPKPEKYQHLEGCYIKSIDEVVPYGTSTPSPKVCARYICSEEWLQTHTCGKVIVVPPLIKVQDREKPYPDCCPRAQAPETTISTD